jgi:hypothetical protein
LRYQYDVRSETDVCFYTQDENEIVLATEMKAHKAFSGGASLWHHDSRGVEMFCALYGYNAPTVLLTQKNYKLVVENRARTRILTYPYESDTNKTSYVRSLATSTVDLDLLRIIVICLLSGEPSASQQEKQIDSKKPYNEDGIEEPLFDRDEAADEIVPSYFSGYDENGNAIRRLIRVTGSKQLKEIEEQDIAIASIK